LKVPGAKDSQLMRNDQADLFKRALEMRDRGDLEQATLLIEQLLQDDKNSANAYLVLGDLYSDLGLIEKALSAFHAAVELKPYSQLASISLFTLLWKAGEKERALEEMKRFLSHSESADYEEILNEIMHKI
jgi:predicted Zn-dependent protease